jgi:hypothetical protein
MRRETSTIEEAETMTAAEMIRAMDLYRELSGRPLVETPTVVVAEVAPVAPEPIVEPKTEPSPAPADAPPPKPAASDATVTPLDVTRKRP